MRWRSRSMSSTLTLTVSPIERISLGWLTCDQDSSEMWIRPSMPSRSTNAPKSTMFEIWPFDDETRLQAVEDLLADLLALLLEHRAAREHDVVARAVELDHLRLDLRAHVLVEVRHAADVDERGGQEAAHAEVDDQAALDDLDDGALDRLAGLGGRFDAPPRLLEAGALLGHDQAAVLVLLGEDDRVDLLAEVHLVVRVDGLADRQLVGRDDALGLVADVDEHLVLVDAHDVAGDDLALLDRAEGGVVVGDDLAVDLEQQPVRPVDHAGLRILHHCLHRPKRSAAVSLPGRCLFERRSGETSAPAWSATATCSSAARASPASPSRASSPARGARVLVIDRYEIGERQTSACAMPTVWLAALDLMALAAPDASTSSSCTRRSAPRAGRCRGRSRRSTTASCARCCGSRPTAPELEFETATVTGRDGDTVHTDRGELRAPLIVDALGWRRVLSNATPIQPPERAPLARPRGPPARQRRGDGAVDRRRATCAPATPGASPRGDELRVGVGSFWPTHHVKEPTVRLAGDLGLPPEGYQGNWIPHQLRARGRGRRLLRRRLGRALPAADRRGDPHGAVLRARLRARAARGARRAPHARAGARALRRLLRRRTRASSAGCCGAQRAVGPAHAEPRASARWCARSRAAALASWAFDHYLAIAPPSFVAEGPPPHISRTLAAAPA